MAAFYYVPAAGSAALQLGIFMAAALLMACIYQAQPIPRLRKVIAIAVVVAVLGGVTLFADDYIVRDCDTMPYWTVEYFFLCYWR